VSWPAVSWRHPQKEEAMKEYFDRIRKYATELDMSLVGHKGRKNKEEKRKKAGLLVGFLIHGDQ